MASFSLSGSSNVLFKFDILLLVDIVSCMCKLEFEDLYRLVESLGIKSDGMVGCGTPVGDRRPSSNLFSTKLSVVVIVDGENTMVSLRSSCSVSGMLGEECVKLSVKSLMKILGWLFISGSLSSVCLGNTLFGRSSVSLHSERFLYELI